MPDPPQKEDISAGVDLPGFSAFHPGIVSDSLSSHIDGHDVRQVEVSTPYACFMTERRPYPSDLSDARWALIAPRLTAWRQARTDAGVNGRTPTHDLRDIFNAILYINRTGIAWRYLPHDFPPYRTVYGYFAAWSKEGIFTELNYQLTGLVRDHHGRTITPTASIMDSQSVKTSTNVPLSTQGTDAGKKSSAANAASSPTPSASSSPSPSPPPAPATTPSASTCSTRPPPPTPPSPKPGSTPASKTASSNTAPHSASTSRPSPKTPKPKASA